MNNFIINRILVLLIFFAQTNLSFSQKNENSIIHEPSEEEMNWLRNQIHPIETYDPKNEDRKDLDILGKLIGNSKVVALGENTHDSKEIFNIKHRIIKYLVKNKNFDIFALEGNMPESNKFNDFINNGKESPLKLLKGLHYKWIWRNQEFIDLLEWMKIYNQGNSKIVFTGVDMQYYQGPIKELEAIFIENKYVLDQILELNELLSEIHKKLELSRYPNIPYKKIRKPKKILSGIKKTTNKLLSKNNKELALQNVRLLEQYIENMYSPYSRLRDSFMAENLLWTTRQNPNSKIIIWAHNEHIKKTARKMGEYIVDNLGNDYVNIGFTFGEGNYNAINLKTMELVIQDAEKPQSDTYEYYFSQLGVNSFILDLKSIKKNKPKMGEWLLNNYKFRRIGSIKPLNEFVETNLAKDYDIIIYINKSTATQILN